MVRQFFKDSVIYGLAALLARGISILLLPLYTHALNPSEFGIVDFIAILTNLVLLTVALEISQGLARALGDAPSDQERRSYASTALWFTLVAYTLFTVAALALAEPISAALLGSATLASTIRIGAISAWCSGLVYLVQNQLRWDLRARASALLGVVIALITVVCSFLLVSWWRMGVNGVLSAQALGGAGGLLVGLYFARGTFKLQFDGAKCREMLRFSIPLVPSSIGVFVTLYIDRIAIKELMTIDALGIFGTGYRIASIVGLLMLGFQGALTPIIYANHQRPGARDELARIFRYFSAGALLLLAGISLLSRELLLVLATPAYAPAALVVPFLALATLLSSMYIFAPGLNLARRTGVVAVINVVGALINFGLNLLLIPRLGLIGASLATCISAGCIFAAYMVFSQRLFYVPHGWVQLGAATVATALVIAGGMALETDLWISITVKLGLCAVVAGIILALRLVEPIELRRMWLQVSQLRAFQRT